MKFVKKFLDNTKKHLQIGCAGENAVAKYVKTRGMRVLYKNWRSGRMEIDLICEDEETIVFIEVKTRKAQGLTSPIEGINKQKRAKLIKAAKLWLMEHDAWHRPCRFDVAAVLYQEQNMQVKYYDNAFDFSSDTALGGRNTSWQPW